MKAIFAKVKAAVLNVWKTQPARVISVAAAIVVFVAAKAGVVVHEESVVQALALTLPVLLGGNLIHTKTTPNV